MTSVPTVPIEAENESRMFHLGVVLVSARPSVGTWRNSDYPLDPDFTKAGFWQNIAKLSEAACLDFVFSADTEGIFSEYEQTPDHALREGLKVPAYDQSIMAAYMAAATEKIGVVATVSTTASQPWITARRLATLDQMTGGRMGWNVVSTSHSGGMKSFGIDELPPHNERYEKAEEYLKLCLELWDSWDEGALVLDRERGIFIDPDMVKDVHFDGKWYKCDAPLNVPRSPQAGPLIAQAGASPRGIQLAARYADLVFGMQQFREGMVEYYNQVKSAVAAEGRDPNSCKVMFAFSAFIGDTEAEARAKADRHNSLVTPERALVELSGLLGVDLSNIPADTLITEVDAPGARGFLAAAVAGQTLTPTIGEAAVNVVTGAGAQVVGTPEQVADWMEETMSIVSGAGLVYIPIYPPYDLEDFTTQVVPILQSRGLTRKSYVDGTLRENLHAF